MNEELFRVGLPLNLQVIKMKYGERYSTSIVGWEKGSFFIARIPFAQGKPIPISRNDECIIRFLKGGEVYGFQTEVLSIQFYPVPIIFFKYQLDIKFMEIRKSKRYKANIPAKMMYAKKNESREARIADLSETGCLLKNDASEDIPYEVGDIFYVTFRIMDKTLELDCMLRNFRPEEKGKSFGMEFIDMTPDKSEVIRSIIEVLKSVA